MSLLAIALTFLVAACAPILADIAKWEATGNQEKLIEALEDANPSIGIAAAEALGNLQALPALSERLDRRRRLPGRPCFGWSSDGEWPSEMAYRRACSPKMRRVWCNPKISSCASSIRCTICPRRCLTLRM